MTFSTVDGEILGGFAWTPEGSLEEASKEAKLDLIKERDQRTLRLLGMKSTSDQVKDFTDNALLFQIYSLKDSQHAYFVSRDDEYEQLIKPSVPEDRRNGAADFGRFYFHEQMVDHNKTIYSILLASNGKVYYVDTQKGENTYQLAPQDMQDAYAQLLTNPSNLGDVQSLSSVKSESSSEDSQVASQETKEAAKETPAPALWTSDKEAALADFMVSWGNSMNQPGYENKGTKFIDGWSFNVGGSDVSLKASSDGRGDGDYNVVANYQYLTNSVNHIYYFAFDRSGSPIVLYTNQWDGPVLYLKETANADLRAGFADIASR